MGFPLVLTQVTFNDLEWCYWHYFAKFGSFAGQLCNSG